MMILQERSKETAKMILAESKGCYRNALLAFLTFWKQFENGYYVEGWIYDKSIGLVYEHGWIELENGDIVDPTLCLHGEINAEYFPVKKYNEEKAYRISAATLPAMKYNDDGYMEMYIEAMQKCSPEIAEQLRKQMKGLIA